MVLGLQSLLRWHRAVVWPELFRHDGVPSVSETQQEPKVLVCPLLANLSELVIDYVCGLNYRLRRLERLVTAVGTHNALLVELEHQSLLVVESALYETVDLAHRAQVSLDVEIFVELGPCVRYLPAVSSTWHMAAHHQADSLVKGKLRELRLVEKVS